MTNYKILVYGLNKIKIKIFNNLFYSEKLKTYIGVFIRSELRKKEVESIKIIKK